MSHHWGYLGAITAALLFSISATFNKIVLGSTHPIIVAGVIYTTAGLALLIVRGSPLNKRILALLETPTETDDSITKKDLSILALVILSGALIAPVLYMVGLQATTAVNASLLLNTEALFTVLIAYLFLKERATKKDYAGIAIIFLGAVLVTTNDFTALVLSTGILGNLLIIGACLFWGIDNSVSKFLCVKQDLVLITALKCLIGGVLILSASQLLGIPFNIPLATIPYLFTVGAFGIGFSILFFLFGLREIGAMKTGIIFSTSSLFGALLAFLILQEPLTLIQIAAGFAMFLGVFLLYKEPKELQKTTTCKA